MLVSYLPFRLAQKHYFQSGRQRQGYRGRQREEGGREGGRRTAAAIWRLPNRRCTTDVRAARDRLGLQLLRLVANNSPSLCLLSPPASRAHPVPVSPLTTPIAAIRVSVVLRAAEPRCNGNTTTLTRCRLRIGAAR